MNRSGYFPELEGLSLNEFIANFERPLAEVEGDDDAEKVVWYQEVAQGIAGFGQEGVEYLVHSLEGADELHLRGALLGLSFAGGGEVEQTLERYLTDERPLVRAEAVDGLNYRGVTRILPQVLALVKDDSPYVAGSALRFLAGHAPTLARPLLIQALDSSDPILLQNAIDELDEMGDESALPRIRELMEHPDPWVRQAAATAVSSAGTTEQQDHMVE